MEISDFITTSSLEARDPQTKGKSDLHVRSLCGFSYSSEEYVCIFGGEYRSLGFCPQLHSIQLHHGSEGGYMMA
jgi:hypothetical protein